MRGPIHQPIFLLAIAAAIVIKFGIHETEQPAERVIEAPVTYNPPSDDVVSYQLVDKVRVGLRGKASEIAALTVFNVDVTVDVPGDRFGPTGITLTPSNIRTQGGEFEVFSLDPNRFTIRVEPRLNADIPITAQLLGEPAAGSTHLEPVVRPPKAKVSGPDSHVRRILRLDAPVRLDGHARTFTETVPIASPDPLVQVIEPTFVTVEVPMQEPELSISFEELRQERAPQ